MRTLVNIDIPELAPAIDFYRKALALTLNRIIDGDEAELAGASFRSFPNSWQGQGKGAEPR